MLSVGLGATVQDFGRPGWRRFGVPPSGAMDREAAFWANNLVNNEADLPVIELLLQGASILVMSDTWLAITGSSSCSTHPTWEASLVKAGTVVAFSRACPGVWTYLAVPGGFETVRWLGSASVFPRGRLGDPLKIGDMLTARGKLSMSSQIVARTVSEQQRPNYGNQAPLPFWPGPQWDDFSVEDRRRFTESVWVVSARSDRVGYRLDGPTLSSSPGQIISEPVLVGSVQVPPNGQPIVTMRDGPTVGGYPKVALLESAAISRLAQSQPGTKVSFQLIA